MMDQLSDKLFSEFSRVNREIDILKAQEVKTGGSGGPLADAYATVTDGTTPATASGSDTFKLRTANSALTIVTANNDATHGDNALFTVVESALDHGGLSGLTDDDHTIYLLADGTRPLTGNWNAGNFNITAAALTSTDQIYIQSASPPKLTIDNTTASNADGGRQAIILFSGVAGDTTPLDQASITAEHDGAGADDNSRLIIKANNGSGLAEALRIDSNLDTIIAANSSLILTNSTDTSGTGVLARNSAQYSVDVTSGQTLSLVELDHKNTDIDTGDSQFYGLRIWTDTDALDTGAGLSVVNYGHSDNIYLDVRGKAGPTASAPTGIGIDLNRSGAGENSASMTGIGLFVLDWSSTDQGADGPHGVRLKKQNDPDTQHPLLEIESNVNSVRFITPRGGGYSASSTMGAMLEGIGGTTLWKWEAGGQYVFVTDGLGVQWDMTSGNRGYIISNGTELAVQSPSGQVRVQNNDNTANLVTLTNAGALDIHQGVLNVGTADTTQGTIKVFGAGTGSTEGGEIQLELAADHDATINSINIDAYQDDLRIYAGGNVWMTLTGTTGRLGLGVGATVPTEELHVVGVADNSYVARFEQSNSTSFSLINIANTASANTSNSVGLEMRLLTDAQERGAFRVDTSFNDIADGTRNTRVAFAMSDAGTFGDQFIFDGSSFGIDASPTQKLDVNGDTRLRGHIYDSNNLVGSSSDILSQDAGGVIWVARSSLTGLDHGNLDGLTDDDHTQYFLADASRIISNGDPLITITNTNAANNANVSQIRCMFNSSTQEREFTRIDSTSVISTDATRTGKIEFYAIDSGSFLEALTVYGGKVGVGNADPPTQDLDVNGDTRLRGHIYDSNNSAGTNDYVFSRDAGGVIWKDGTTLFAAISHTHAASDVTSGTFANARIAESNVTQHQTALSILETQIPDGSLLARLADNETITGNWTFDKGIVVNNSAANSDTRIAGQSEANAFFLDASSGFLGVWTGTPSTLLHVQETATATPTIDAATVAIFQRSNATTSQAFISVIAGPTATKSGINFGDQNDEDVGGVHYNHNNDELTLRANGTSDRLTIDGSGYLYQSTPASAPTDGDIANGQIVWYLNEGSNELNVRVRYSSGTLKTGIIGLS